MNDKDDLLNVLNQDKITDKSSVYSIKGCTSPQNKLIGVMLSLRDSETKNIMGLNAFGDISSGNCATFRVPDGDSIKEISLRFTRFAGIV